VIVAFSLSGLPKFARSWLRVKSLKGQIMDINEIFSSGFDSETLTVSINAAPFAPGLLASRKLYREVPMATTSAVIELIDEVLRLVQSSPRGAPADIHRAATRRIVEFATARLLTQQTIHADSWQNKRGFGTGALASIEAERDRYLAEMRRRLEASIEFHRTRALAGVVLDADGSVMLDLLAEFGVSQNTQSMALGSPTTNVRNQIIAAKRKSEIELGSMRPKSWLAVCSASFFDALTAHPSVAATVEGWDAATVLRDDVRADFGFANVQFVEVRNSANVTWIEADTAYLVPEGVPDLFLTHYAPADYMETANTMAQPLYAKAEIGSMGRSIRIESQTNPVSFCTKPRAVVKLTA